MEEELVTLSVAAKNFFFDLVLPIVEKVFQGFNIYFLFMNSDTYWAVATILVILLPGMAELLYWTVECCRGTSSNGRICKWIWGFGPFTFHIGVWCW